MSTTLQTKRLSIHPFTVDDLIPIHRILDQTFGDGTRVNDESAIQERRSWIEWQSLNQVWLPKLHQPPYGERAIILKATDAVIGAVGLVPCLDMFEQIPALRATGQASGYATPEVGLFWAIDPALQQQGYATEAARAMIDHAFTQLRLKRIIATTEYDNVASQGVMRKLGMRIERNPLPDPVWLQVVGVLENSGV